MKTKTVLIIEDSAALRQEASTTLNRAGYDVIEASDGMEALNKLIQAQLDEHKVHLIISAANMPSINGITLVGKIKKDPAYKFIPFIMLTNESANDKIDLGMLAGAKTWLAKPFQPEQLLTAVSKLVLAGDTKMA